MDRRRPRAALLGILAAGVSALAAAGVSEPPLRAIRWTATATDPIRAMTRTPSECLRRPASADEALRVEVGRAAFRTPVLLGGQAARAGLTCESCHRSGRANPDFHFPGVSGDPGTADVTDSLFSSHRGDGVFNPRPIPDLSGPKARLKVDQAPQSHALEGFIHGLVTEEFDGPEPTPRTLAGLADYVRALGPAACPAIPDRPLDLGLMMDDVRRALSAARGEARLGDAPTAILMVAAARARLGLIDERYPAPAQAPLRRRLRVADARLAELQQALRDHRADVDAGMENRLSDLGPLQADLARAEPASLFDRRHLRIILNRRLPG